MILNVLVKLWRQTLRVKGQFPICPHWLSLGRSLGAHLGLTWGSLGVHLGLTWSREGQGRMQVIIFSPRHHRVVSSEWLTPQASKMMLPGRRERCFCISTCCPNIKMFQNVFWGVSLAYTPHTPAG